MQKLNMIEAFSVLDEGTDATFVHPEGQGDQSRTIKFRINTATAVNLWLTPVEYDYAEGKVTAHDQEHQIFLCHVEPGFDEIEFYYRGSFCLTAIGGDVWLDTFDNATFSVEDADPVSFARLVEREERDPRILEMERAARHNMEEMRRAMRAEIEAMRDQYVQQSVAPAPSTAPVGTTNAPTAVAPAPSGDGKEGTGAADPVATPVVQPSA